MPGGVLVFALPPLGKRRHKLNRPSRTAFIACALLPSRAFTGRNSGALSCTSRAFRSQNVQYRRNDRLWPRRLHNPPPARSVLRIATKGGGAAVSGNEHSPASLKPKFSGRRSSMERACESAREVGRASRETATINRAMLCAFPLVPVQCLSGRSPRRNLALRLPFAPFDFQRPGRSRRLTRCDAVIVLGRDHDRTPAFGFKLLHARVLGLGVGGQKVGCDDCRTSNLIDVFPSRCCFSELPSKGWAHISTRPGGRAAASAVAGSGVAVVRILRIAFPRRIVSLGITMPAVMPIRNTLRGGFRKRTDRYDPDGGDSRANLSGLLIFISTFGWEERPASMGVAMRSHE
jgi:hypothetical protein